MSEQQKQTERDQVLATIETEGVRFINLEFTDVVGMAKCVTIPVEQFPDCLTHGKWFDGSALEGFAFAFSAAWARDAWKPRFKTSLAIC